jgi:hypothetical protein
MYVTTIGAGYAVRHQITTILAAIISLGAAGNYIPKRLKTLIEKKAVAFNSGEEWVSSLVY